MTALWKLEDDRSWTTVPAAGFPSEAELHDLIESAPQLLPLAGSPDLVVLGREVRLGSGAADLVAVEPGGRVALIEVKLGKNAEARRAVVAQLLAYAAALYGSSIEDLNVLLRPHLEKRGVTSVAALVAERDQTGSYDASEFAATLRQSLTGQLRLVFVLDEVPEDLTRLVGFLETVTNDGLVIDLVTIGSYDIGGTRVVVPQRVEPDPMLRTPSARGAATSHSPKPVKGSEIFEASITEAAAEHRSRLQHLLEWAQKLERDGHAELYSTTGKGRWTLLPKVAGDWAGLVTIWNDGGPGLTLHRGVFEATRATAALHNIDPSGTAVGMGTKASANDDALLEQIRQAYVEAKGRKISTTG